MPRLISFTIQRMPSTRDKLGAAGAQRNEDQITFIAFIDATSNIVEGENDHIHYLNMLHIC